MTNSDPQTPAPVTRGSNGIAWLAAGAVALAAIVAVAVMVTNQQSDVDPAEVARAQDLGRAEGMLAGAQTTLDVARSSATAAADRTAADAAQASADARAAADAAARSAQDAASNAANRATDPAPVEPAPQ